MNYLKIKECDISNGPGIRLSLFVTGCRNHCKGCFQPETWDFKSGIPFTMETERYFVNLLKKYPYQGVTILGGDPFEPENEKDVASLCRDIKLHFPDKDIWVYTGYYYEDLIGRPILSVVDVLVDSPYIESLKDMSSSFRGSLNQRFLKLKGGVVVEEMGTHVSVSDSIS